MRRDNVDLDGVMGEVMTQRQNESESDDNERVKNGEKSKRRGETSRQDKLMEGSKRKAKNENDDERRRVIV